MTFLRVLAIIVGGLLALVGGGCTVLFLSGPGQIGKNEMPFFLTSLAALAVGVALIAFSAKRRS
jgi:hypothetical protein